MLIKLAQVAMPIKKVNIVIVSHVQLTLTVLRILAIMEFVQCVLAHQALYVMVCLVKQIKLVFLALA